jgi:hypothetical protein
VIHPTLVRGVTSVARILIPITNGATKLGAMGSLFRLSLGVRRDPAVEAWLNRQSGALGTIARKWFDRMRACGFDVLEMMHDGCPVACVKDVPFASVNAFKAHVNVGFFLGAELEDPAGLLEGTGKRMRHVKIEPDAPLDSRALGELIQASYADVKARLRG